MKKRPASARLGAVLRDLTEAVARARARSGSGYGSGLIEDRVRDYQLVRDPSDAERLRCLDQICEAAADYRVRVNATKSQRFTPDERAKLARAVNAAFRIRDELRRTAALRSLGMV
jgi:hypothetical protein